MITVVHMPVRIIFGVDSIKKLGEQARNLGADRAMVVTYPDIRRIGLLDEIVNALKAVNIDSLVFEKIESNPRTSTVDEAAAIVRTQKIPLIIGLGGGSAMDCAKAARLASSGTKSIWDYTDPQTAPASPAANLIQIPTLAGTGSEINYFAIITNWQTHEKVPVINEGCWAQVAIIDPQLTVTAPRGLTASGGVDMFVHALERYLTTDIAPPMSMGFREIAMKMVLEFLPRVLADTKDIEAREQLCWVSAYATSPVASMGGRDGAAPIHAFQHTLAAYYDIPHGAGVAALLVPVLKSLLPMKMDRIDLIGKNIFGKKDGIKATAEWLDSIDMNLKLRDMAVSLSNVDEMAKAVITSTPGIERYYDEKDIINVLQEAY